VWTYLAAVGLILLALIARGFAGSPRFIGWLGEKRVRRWLEEDLHAPAYRIFHNVLLPTADGTTQIDHVIISPFGLFTIETKNMGGAVFGAAKDATWTQKIGAQTHRFQNPLRQDYKHRCTLADLLDIPLHKIHTVVVFVRPGVLRTAVGDNVTEGRNCTKFILGHLQREFTESQTAALADSLEKIRLAATGKNSWAHIQHVRSLVQGRNKWLAEPRQEGTPLDSGDGARNQQDFLSTMGADIQARLSQLPNTLETAFARQKTMTVPCVVTFVLYWCFILPGLVANLLWLAEANRLKRTTGEEPLGTGALRLMLLTIPAFALFVAGTFFVSFSYIKSSTPRIPSQMRQQHVVTSSFLAPSTQPRLPVRQATPPSMTRTTRISASSGTSKKQKPPIAPVAVPSRFLKNQVLQLKDQLIAADWGMSKIPKEETHQWYTIPAGTWLHLSHNEIRTGHKEWYIEARAANGTILGFGWVRDRDLARVGSARQ